MNVIFHTTTAIGVTVLLTDTERLGDSPGLKQVLPTALYAFATGIISHGVLDYVPHCYPINSKVDFLAGLAMIISTTWLTNKHFRPIVGFAFIGTVFPDLFDLGPKLLNKYLNLEWTMPENIFPWHRHTYSGSIYNGGCNVSTLNHVLLIVTILLIVWARWRDFKSIFRKRFI